MWTKMRLYVTNKEAKAILNEGRAVWMFDYLRAVQKAFPDSKKLSSLFPLSRDSIPFIPESFRKLGSMWILDSLFWNGTLVEFNSYQLHEGVERANVFDFIELLLTSLAVPELHEALEGFDQAYRCQRQHPTLVGSFNESLPSLGEVTARFAASTEEGKWLLALSVSVLQKS